MAAIFRIQVQDGLLPAISSGAKTLWQDLSGAKYSRNAANAAREAALHAVRAAAWVEQQRTTRIYRRVLFVAFRGVMTSHSHEIRSQEVGEWPSLDPFLVGHMKSFIDRFSAVIVLSTNWSSRPELYQKILSDLASCGIKKSVIVGETDCECDWDAINEDLTPSEVEQIKLCRAASIS
jgi:hypothetical protein